MKKIVIIEQIDSTREFLEDILRERFPFVLVRSMTKEEYEEDIAVFLLEVQPTVVFLSAELRPWKNEVFGSEGTELLGFIKEALPEAIVVFNATDTVYLDKALSHNMAHIVLEKGELSSSIESVAIHLEIH